MKPAASPRVILQMGTGSDLQGGDYTRAAVGAVSDALQHCSLDFLRAFEIAPAALKIEVIIGVADPAAVAAEQVRACLPHGEVSVTLRQGGLDVPGRDGGDPVVLASAALLVRADLPNSA